MQRSGFPPLLVVTDGVQNVSSDIEDLLQPIAESHLFDQARKYARFSMYILFWYCFWYTVTYIIHLELHAVPKVCHVAVEIALV